MQPSRTEAKYPNLTYEQITNVLSLFVIQSSYVSSHTL